MSKKFLTNIDLAKNELQNAVIQQLAAAPSSPLQGQVYYNTTDDNVYVYDGAAWVDMTAGAGAGSGDLSSIETSSTDSQLPLFNGTTGKSIKKSTLTGLLKGTAGVVSAATAGTDYLTAASTNALTNKTFDANGSGNAITNIETADFATNVIDNDTTLAANSSTRLATQAATKAYVDNAVAGLSWKQAVRVATTANGTLATAYANGQTVDGVTLATGDRILIKNQTTATENGIYTVNASGAPTRATDADSGAELVNASVLVQTGTQADTAWTCTTNATITVGSTPLAFANFDGGSVPVATTSVAGKAELATQAEAEARSVNNVVVTPGTLVNFPIKKVFTIGDGTSTSIGCSHSLGTTDVIVGVYQAADGAEVECDVARTSTSVVTLGFTVAPAANSLKVVVLG